MKKLMCTYCVLLIIVFFGACERERFQNIAEPFSVKVSVNYPSHYLSKTSAEINVILVNTINGQSEILDTDGNGRVCFENVIKGTYDLMFFQQLDAETALSEGDTLFGTAGISEGKVLNLTNMVCGLELMQSVVLEVLELRPSLPGDLLIKEVFYTGSSTPMGKRYWSDVFVELYNNTDEIIFLDSLCIGSVYGNSGQGNTQPSVFINDQEHVYLKWVWMFPGQGNDCPLMPGESVVIAQDGMNHRDDPNGNPNSIDLSGADFETYVVQENGGQEDIDITEVENMIKIHSYSANLHDWIFESFGEAQVLFSLRGKPNIEFELKPNSTDGQQLIKIENSIVIDAFEALAEPSSGNFKRIPFELDKGFVYCQSIYNSQSCRRKMLPGSNDKIRLMDTNNSGFDFAVIPFPTPGTFE